MPTAKQDSNFALSILEVAVHSDECKQHLAQGAVMLRDAVIAPVLAKLDAGEELDAHSKGVIDFLASEHSSDGMQWGGALQGHSKQEIMGSIDLQKELLSTLAARMTAEHIASVSSIDELAGVTKAMTDCSFCYVEKLPAEAHSAGYAYTKDMIMPTPEELAIRIGKAEVGAPAHRAISYGIGKEAGVDIAPVGHIPDGAVRVHSAGKAAFDDADAFKRAQIIATQYDKAFQHVTELEEQGAHEDVDAELKVARKTLSELTKKMEFYNVPFDKARRPDDFHDLPVPQPSIQKLARFGADSPGKPLPLVATASGTTARTLIALHDVGGFNADDHTFNPEAAQYVSTVLCGTIVHGGHHSVLEVGEMYNRLLDVDAINALEATGKASREEAMDYYRIGDSASLIPEAMRDAVSLEYHAKNQADIRASIPHAAEEPAGVVHPVVDEPEDPHLGSELH